MPSNIYTAGLRNVGSYQVSGYPYITGSNGAMTNGLEFKVQFPNVTKSVTVINSGSSGDGELRIHFNTATNNDVTTAPAHHYLTLANDGDSVTFDTKCKEIYITSVGTQGFELFAELTFVHTGSMIALTGSGLTQLGPSSYQ
tara:strand:- start:5 stop:430 length:426 start_codon:yes stop_codon:yes gene_type:complete